MKVLRYALVLSLAAFSSATWAAILHIGPDGKLLGASSVLVDGVSYDVSFQDGSCIEVFSGVTARKTSSFPFRWTHCTHPSRSAIKCFSAISTAIPASSMDAPMTFCAAPGRRTQWANLAPWTLSSIPM
jgi:hypothetical protein